MTAAKSAYQASANEISRDELVNGEISQVYYIATRIRERLPQQVELEDLVSAGVVGLLEAARSFDSTKQVQFRTFAKFRIHGAIMDSLRETDWGSRGLRKKGREIAEASARLQARFSRQPSEAEIAHELGIPTERLHKLLGQIDSLQVSGQQIAHSGDQSDSIDLIESAPNQNDPDPLEICLEGERKALLAEAISRLTEREQMILSLYYREELTMKEISEVVGISLSRVSQVRESIIGQLRTFLEELQMRPVKSTSEETGEPRYA